MSEGKNAQGKFDKDIKIARKMGEVPDQGDKYATLWFWAGFLVSIPISFFILDNDKHTALLIKNFTILYGLIPALGLFIYRGWKGIKLGEPFLENSLVKIIFLYSVMFVGGHAIGFATMHLFEKLH